MAIDKNMPILIVDDYRTMLRIIGGLLRQIGFLNVDEAPDGETAYGMFRNKHYGMVISDWNMEPMSGLKLLETIRAGDLNKDVPFIMVTSESKTENVMAARQAGVSNYIVKPFNAETLKAKMAAVLGEF